MRGTHIQIQNNEYINLMVHRTVTMVSVPLHSYNPYERIGREMVQAVYRHCEYSVMCKSKREDDRLYVHHQRIAHD